MWKERTDPTELSSDLHVYTTACLLHIVYTQLQSLYETILGENIDKRNFRKRIAENCCIEKTDQIDKTSSRRGASLYKFNDRAYRRDPKFKI